MSFLQWLTTIMISTFLLGVSCDYVQGESRPGNPEGKALHIEMSAYVDKYVKDLGIDADDMQYATLVLPILELDSPAVTYGWGLPAPTRANPNPEVKIWIALVTFHQDLMLLLEPNQRRAVAAHEVAHMTEECMSFEYPSTDFMNDLEKALAEFKYMLLVESCADILSAELTSPEDALSTLKFFRDKMYQGNALLIQRIRVIERLIEREGEEDVE